MIQGFTKDGMVEAKSSTIDRIDIESLPTPVNITFKGKINEKCKKNDQYRIFLHNVSYFMDTPNFEMHAHDRTGNTKQVIHKLLDSLDLSQFSELSITF